MAKVGYAKFQYKIPYDDEWYIILTSNKYHFYFNSKQKVSYWQLSDIFQNFPSINQDEFVESIDFNELTILIARNNGLKGLDDYYSNKSDRTEREKNYRSKVTEKKEEVTTQQPVAKEAEVIVDNAIESLDDEHSDLDEEESNEIIKLLLKEQGLLKDEDQGEEAKGIITGYSSSEYENESDTEEKNEQGEEVEEDLHLDLDTDSDKKADFLKLLNRLESKISIYDPWDIVEEELIEELVKSHEYYSLDNKNEREQIFNEWCASKGAEESNETEQAVEEESDLKFPTEKLKFLLFLQDHKPIIKKSSYEQFHTESYQQIGNTALNNNAKLMMYGKYKEFLEESGNEERNIKKLAKYEPGVNLKKLKLQNYLKLKGVKTNATKEEYDEILKYISENRENHLKCWLHLINSLNLPQSLVEDANNFIVGDEKRLDCYLEYLKNQFI